MEEGNSLINDAAGERVNQNHHYWNEEIYKRTVEEWVAFHNLKKL